MNLDELRINIVRGFTQRTAFKEGLIQQESGIAGDILFSLISKKHEFTELLKEIKNKWEEILNPHYLYILDLYLLEYYNKNQELMDLAWVFDSNKVSSSLEGYSLSESSIDNLSKCLEKTGISKKKDQVDGKDINSVLHI